MPRVFNQKIKILYLMRIFLEQTDEEHPMSVKELLCIHDFQFYALCRGTIIGNIAGLQIQGLNLMRVGSAQPVGNLTVAPAGLQQRGNLFFILLR